MISVAPSLSGLCVLRGSVQRDPSQPGCAPGKVGGGGLWPRISMGPVHLSLGILDTVPDEKPRSRAGPGMACTVFPCSPSSKLCLRHIENDPVSKISSNYHLKIFLPEKIHLGVRFMPSAYKCSVKEQCRHSLLRITL